jgi:signal transduction histidine kinase
MTHLRETFKSGKHMEFEDDLDNIKFFHSFYPVYDEKGHVNYVAAYDRDITEKKHAEEQLKKNADSLRELNATKDKFFGIIAHDLRNPFSSLLGASEILSNNVRQYDIDSIETFSRLSYDAAKSCYALLENLLEWSRAQTGNLKFNPLKVNITEIIEENLSVLKTFAANKKITLYSKVSEDIFSLADRDMLKAILRNLLNNALKFTCLNGEVFVNAIEEKNHIIISVKDNGIGIPKKDIDKLFRIDIKYTKVGTNEERGTGLGLLLCKEFVEQHGGKIWVESDEGEGSEFKFTIPLKKES